MITTTEFAGQVAAAINEDSSLVSSMVVHWEKYLQQGVHANVTIRRWRGNDTVSWGDLGMALDKESQDEMNKLFSLSRSLLPYEIDKELRNLDAAMRRNVTNHAVKIFSSNGNKGVDFIPYTLYEKMKEKHLDLEANYFHIRNKISGSDEAYEELRTQIERSLGIAAATAYSNLLKLNPETLKATPQEIAEGCSMSLTMPQETIAIKTVDCFCQSYVSKAMISLPDRETLFNSFKVHLKLEAIPTPSMFEQDRLVAVQIRAERDEVEGQARLAATNRKESLANARAIREQRIETAAAIRRTKVTEVELHEQKLLEMQEDALRQLKAKTSRKVNALVESLVQGLCGPLYEGLEHIILKISESGKMNNRLVHSARNTLEQAEKIASFLDTKVGDDLIAMMDTIKLAIGESSADRDVDDVKSKMLDFALIVREEMRAANCAPRLNLPLPDMPDVEVLETAKGRLGIRSLVNQIELEL